MLRTNEKGQSLVEVLVVGVVSAIMIIALVMIILNSLKNAQFAQNQTQATKIAQDTIDKIRILRDNNSTNTLTKSGSPSACFNELWNATGNFKCDDISQTSGDPVCYYQLISDSSLDKVDYINSSVDLTGGFSRRITVRQTNADEVRMTVTILWKDTSGEHNSVLETVITKPNYDCISP